LYVASIEFERAVFYETDNKNIAKCRYYKALCYKGLGETDRALEELNEINLSALPDSLFFLVSYEQALCNYLNNDPNKSLWNIDEIRFRFSDSLKTLDIIPLNILCLNDVRKWDDAIILWNYLLDKSRLADSARSAIKSKIVNLYEKRNLPKFRSPGKAETLSRFIPGSGQIYCGALFEGSFNLLMNAAVLGFSIYEFYTKYYFTGYIVGLTLFNKTYHGGIRRANQLAAEKNIEALNRFDLETSILLISITDNGYTGKWLRQMTGLSKF
jgi:tetratricopeptide (TPR) repeat protein